MTWISRMIQRSEISRQLVAILLFGGNVTMLLPFGVPLSTGKVRPAGGRAKKLKEKMHSQRPCLLSRIFAHETYE
jgi:hypothetical protein